MVADIAAYVVELRKKLLSPPGRIGMNLSLCSHLQLYTPYV